MDADELDLEIDRLLAGGATDDPVLGGLGLLATEPVGADVPPPPPLPAPAVAPDPTAPTAPPMTAGSPVLARVAAAVLATTMLSVASTNLFFGEWLADWLEFNYDPHVFREGGLAYLAVGLVLAAGAWRPRYLMSAVLVGVPLGLTLGIHGILEISGAAEPAAEVMHVTQGAAALVLGAAWVLPKRPPSRRRS